MPALKKQCDGSHYTEMKLQPIELAYLLGTSPAFCKLAKYITRNKVDSLVDYEKAVHSIELEKELRQHAWKYKLSKWKTFFVYKILRRNLKSIEQFTDNVSIRTILHQMLLQDYDSAIMNTRLFIKAYKIKNKLL